RRGDELLMARTRDFKTVLVPGAVSMLGSYVTVELTGTTGSTFTGQVVGERKPLPMAGWKGNGAAEEGRGQGRKGQKKGGAPDGGERRDCQTARKARLPDCAKGATARLRERRDCQTARKARLPDCAKGATARLRERRDC